MGDNKVDKDLLIEFLNKFKDTYETNKNKVFDYNHLNELNRLLIIHIFYLIKNINIKKLKKIIWQRGGAFFDLIKRHNDNAIYFNNNFINIPTFIDVIINVINKTEEAQILLEDLDNRIINIQSTTNLNKNDIYDIKKLRLIIINDIIKKILILIYYIIILNLHLKKIIERGTDYNDVLFNDLKIILLIIKSDINNKIDNILYNYIYNNYINQTKKNPTASTVASILLKKPLSQRPSNRRGQSSSRQKLLSQKSVQVTLDTVSESRESRKSRHTSLSNKLKDLKELNESSITETQDVQAIIRIFNLQILNKNLNNDVLGLINLGDDIITEMERP